MHENSLTPIRTVRFVIPSLVVLLVLIILSYTLPFYSYTYFFLGKTMTYLEIGKANSQIMIPIIGNVVAFIFMLISLLFMLFLSKNKVGIFVTKLLTLIAAFIFFALFIVAVCRLWVIPFEFDYSAVQDLLIGYILYLFATFFGGVLGCYMLALHEK